MKKENQSTILGYPFSRLDCIELFDFLMTPTHERIGNCASEPTVIHFLNAFCISLAEKNSELQNIYKHPNSINVVDGISLSIVSRIFENYQIPRIRGTDFVRRILSENRYSGLNLGLIGGSDETVTELKMTLEMQFEGLELAMVYAPPFIDVHLFAIDEIVEELKTKRIDLCLLAIGTPKQDQLASILAGRINTKFICIGAAIDFIAGVKSECPRWLTKIGLEWFFRLISEPKRLWKRYTLELLQFFLEVFSFYFSKKFK